MVTQDEWLGATASTTLDMAEMDKLVQESVALWADYEEKKKVASAAYLLAEKKDAQIMEALKSAGKTKYFVDGVGTMSLSSKPVVRVPSSIESKKEFFKYLRSISEEVLFSMTTVNSNTLNSWYKQKLDEALNAGNLGFSVPGIEQPTMRETLSFRKG